MAVSVFLPCRQGSERVPNKNIKPFADTEHGLVSLKLRQLLACRSIDEVVLSTNDEAILKFASTVSDKKLRIHKRKDSLCTSTTSTDELVAHALELIPTGHILWTHVTSPFINTEQYQLIIEQYFGALEKGYDSLMTTTLIHGFLWNGEAPINYDRSQEKWPRTQTIEPVHEINSGVFLNSAENYQKFDDRIGCKPFLYTMDKITAHDIDWHEDFVIAEAIAKNGLAKL
ncbi:cytidylyltransferase domain-containing protein [Vibrio paracholerae]|uniref:Acylneuraminate cytidylyltransferase family protein n=1 Tax=Vibrio paracholerae TaxID=650003 RepID=A0ABD7FRS4_9VIBR|nr:acylneuraminate cytidylyltransferase family protein [Vibrio paracholerae]RBM62447.1 acylneuraminate cytidylyltransferase family protein [Vibrio paracholerae]